MRHKCATCLIIFGSALTCILLASVDESHGDDIDIQAAASGNAVGEVGPGVDAVDEDAEADLGHNSIES